MNQSSIWVLFLDTLINKEADPTDFPSKSVKATNLCPSVRHWTGIHACNDVYPKTRKRMNAKSGYFKLKQNFYFQVVTNALISDF